MIAINREYNEAKDNIASYVEEYLEFGKFTTPVV